MEIRHEPSWYNKEQIPYLKYTQLLFSDDFHIQQVSGSPVTRNENKQITWFPIDEEGEIDFKIGKYDTNNQPKKFTFKYEQEGGGFVLV